MLVPDTVHDQAAEMAAEKDMSMKEAVRQMCRSTEGFDV
jgi:hypothetical protein